MFTLEITHKNGAISYSHHGYNNVLIQTKDIKLARMFRKREHVQQMIPFMKKHDPSIESVKIINVKRGDK